MVAETTQNPMKLSGRQFLALKLGWWGLFILYAVFRVFTAYNYALYESNTSLERFAHALELVTNLITWTLAIFLFAKKPNDRIALFVSVMFFTWQTFAQYFWGWLIYGGWFDHLAPEYSLQSLQALFASSPFDFFAYLTAAAVFLTFPTGNWISSGARRFFFGMLGVMTLFSLLTPLSLLGPISSPATVAVTMFYFVILLVARSIPGFLLFWHYRSVQDPIQRQQIKWIATFFVLLAILWVTLVPLILALSFIDTNASRTLTAIAKVLGNLIDLGLFCAFSLSILRYRLWDIDILINRTLVYGALTGALGLVGLVSLAVTDFLIKRFIGDESSIWGVVASALPVAAAFTPLRGGLQNLIDQYFKPEEINFENHFLEFRADIRNMLGTSRMIEIISRQVKKQLDVESACVYLADENGKIPSFTISAESLNTLTAGELVIGADGAEYSLLVPLVISRPIIPDFIGVIVLGRRLNGRGYSTPILESLKLLGANAGEAIYLSRLNEQIKIQAMA